MMKRWRLCLKLTAILMLLHHLLFYTLTHHLKNRQ